LRKAGLARSVREAGGGHVLARPATEITLREIFEALEGAEAFVPCTADPTLCDCAAACVSVLPSATANKPLAWATWLAGSLGDRLICNSTSC